MKIKGVMAILPASLALCLLSVCCTQDRGAAAAPAGSDTAASAPVADVEVTPVVSQKLNTIVKLPAELMPYEDVDVYPNVTGFVKWIKVDRGSRVTAGERIALLEAPELPAQRAEAESKFQGAQSQLAAAQANSGAPIPRFSRPPPPSPAIWSEALWSASATATPNGSTSEPEPPRAP